MSFFSAPLKGIAAFVFGMNFIAILMKLNGSAVSGNLAWDFVFSFVKLELWIASIVVIIVICTLAFRHLENNEQDERLQPKEWTIAKRRQRPFYIHPLPFYTTL